jgi:flagellar export protein FliJ
VKKYRFRLEAVLRVRRIEEERAMAALVLANRALAEADAELERRLDHYREVAQPAGSLAHAEYVKVRSLQDAAAAGVVAAGAARLMAEAEADRKRELWAEAATKVRALERLDERRRDEHAAEVLHEEIITLDEVAASRLVATR